jgi:hypothetical protein
MDAPLRADRAVELFGEPNPITVSGRDVEPVGIDLGQQDGQLVPAAPQFTAGILQHA